MAEPWPTFLVFAHVLGASLWVGGQLVLGVATAALRATLPEETRRPTLRAVARRAQPALWAGLALAAASGLLLLPARGFTVSSLVEEPLLVAKLALTLLAAGGAALHVVAARRGMRPALVGGGAAISLLAGFALVAVGAALRWS